MEDDKKDVDQNGDIKNPQNTNIKYDPTQDSPDKHTRHSSQKPETPRDRRQYQEPQYSQSVLIHPSSQQFVLSWVAITQLLSPFLPGKNQTEITSNSICYCSGLLQQHGRIINGAVCRNCCQLLPINDSSIIYICRKIPCSYGIITNQKYFVCHQCHDINDDIKDNYEKDISLICKKFQFAVRRTS